MLCWFMPYINMNQPQVYTCPTPLGCQRAPGFELPVIEQIPIGCLFYIWSCIYIFLCYILNSSHRLLPLLCAQVCFLYLNLHSVQLSHVVVQLFIHVQLFVTPWIAAHKASLSFVISLSLLKLISIEVVMPSNHLVLCHRLLFMPSVFTSIRVSSNR